MNHTKEDFSIQQFATHGLNYAKAVARVYLYRALEWVFGSVGSLVATLIVLSLVPFLLVALLMAGAYGLKEWLGISEAWAFLLVAGLLWVAIMILLLCHGAIARKVRDRQCSSMEPLLDEIDRVLGNSRSEENTSEFGKDSNTSPK